MQLKMVCWVNYMRWLSILGHKYITPDGTELEGLGVLDFYTESKRTLNWRYHYRVILLARLLDLKIMVVEHIIRMEH